MRTILIAAIMLLTISCEKHEEKRSTENKLCFALNGVTWCNSLMMVNTSTRYIYAETSNDTALFSFLLDKEGKIKANVCTMSTNSGAFYTSVADSFMYNYIVKDRLYIANFEGVMRNEQGHRVVVSNGLMEFGD